MYGLAFLYFSFPLGLVAWLILYPKPSHFFWREKKGFGQIGFLLKETKMVVEGRFCLNLLLSLVVVLST